MPLEVGEKENLASNKSLRLKHNKKENVKLHGRDIKTVARHVVNH